MSKTPFIVFGIFAAICVIVIPLYAFSKEGGEGAGTVQVATQDVESKELFASNCGSCHTLAAAGSGGVVGPDLDATLVPTGVNDETQYEGIASRVLTAVNCGVPPGGGRMPKGILLGEEAGDVAEFVALYAAQIDEGPTVESSSVEPPDFAGCPSGSE